MEILFKNVEVGISLVSLILGIILNCLGFSLKSGKLKTTILLLGLACFVVTAICVHIISKTEY